MVDGVVLPSKAKIMVINFFCSGPYALLFLPSSSCMLFEQMENVCNTMMQPISLWWYAWVGIEAVIVDVNHYLHTQARGAKVSLSLKLPHTN